MNDTTDKPAILVIDDEFGPRESLRFLLMPDHDVVCAESVAAAIDILKEKTVGLVVSDVRMPETDGFEGLRLIREIDPAMPVILFSGYDEEETQGQAIRAGASAFMAKPFDNLEMKAAISEHVRGGGRQATPCRRVRPGARTKGGV